VSTPEQHQLPVYACAAGAVLHAHSSDTLEPAVLLYTFLPAGGSTRLDDVDAKIDVHGSGAVSFLEGLCANVVDRPIGSVVYTQLLNRRGGIECDLTVTRLAGDRFQLVTGTAFGTHDLAWLRRHLPADGSVHVDDVTASRACFGLWGPRSREILQALTKTDLSHGAFPYLRALEIAVGDVPCLALRVTYVGELGYELYCPTEYGLALWDVLVGAGEPYGLLPAGYRAIDSLRLEKGYRAWGSDITPETTPEAAGLGFAVRLDKPAPFLGRDALLAEQAAGGPGERLRCLVLDDPRAVCLGHRVERSIAFASLPTRSSAPGTAIEVDVFGDLVPGTVVAEPLYDPENARIRS